MISRSDNGNQLATTHFKTARISGGQRKYGEVANGNFGV